MECRLECGVESCVGRGWCGECRQVWWSWGMVWLSVGGETWVWVVGSGTWVE